MNSIKHLIREAHRRSLWQVLSLYLVAAWICYEVILALTEGIGLPEWVPGFALVLLLIGLPIVLATAFVQEGHPLQDRDPGPRERAAPPVEAPEAGPRGAPTERPGVTTPVSPSGTTWTAGPYQRSELFTWRRAVVGGVLAFAALGVAVAGVMGMRALGIGPAATLLSGGELDERDILILATFQADDPSLAEVVTEALRIDLHESTVLTLADPAYVAGVLRRMEQDPAEPLTVEAAREVALREGLKGVVSGQVRTVGGRHLLTAGIRAANDGRVLAAFREEAANEEGLLEALDDLGAAIRERAGESLRSVRSGEPLAAVSTRSLPALRLYSRAQSVRHATGDPARAIELLQRAVAEDTAFAMAWRRLGESRRDERRNYAAAVEAITRAYELRERLPPTERYLAEAAYHEFVRDDPAEAGRVYRTLLELHPDHTIALAGLASVYRWSGRHQDAVQLLQRAVEIEPVPAYLIDLASVLVTVGRIEDADRALARARREWTDNKDALSASARLAVIRNDFGTADSLARAIGDRFPEGVGRQESLMLQATVDAIQGRLADGAGHLRHAIEVGLDEGFLSHVDQALIMLTEIHMLAREDTAAAVAEHDRVMVQLPLEDLDPVLFPYHYAAELEARLGNTVRADSLLAMGRAAAEAMSVSAADSAGASPATWIAAIVGAFIALAEGRGDAAVDGFERVQDLMDCTQCWGFEMGLAHQVAGEPDSVIAVWTREVAYAGWVEGTRGASEALSTQMSDLRFWVNHRRPYMLRRLGELHDARGDTAQALRRYSEFLELWADPDPELRPVVQQVRERMARLSGLDPG